MRATRKLAGFLRPYWLWALLAPLLMMLEVAMDLMQPRLVQRIIDQGIAQNDLNMDHNLKAVRTIAVTMPFMMLIVNMGVIATKKR